jgi:hypothetical protein
MASMEIDPVEPPAVDPVEPPAVDPTARYATNVLHRVPPEPGDEARGGDFLFCRFQQRDEIHNELVRQLFSPDAIRNIQRSLALPSTTYQIYNLGTHQYEDAPKPALNPIPNIRFLTFHVQITGNPANPIIFTVVPTLPVTGFLCVHLLNETGAGVLRPDGTTDWTGLGVHNDLFNAFARKVYVELIATGLNPNHVSQYYASFDVYYNRERGTGGDFHKDEFYGTGNDTLFGSLEFIMPDRVATLGTEIILDRAPRAYPARIRPGEARDLLARGAQSFRCVSTNGSVSIFNNKRCIHASPETVTTSLTTPDRIIFDPALHHHRVLNRLNASATTGVADPEAEALNTATETTQRSFIRTWYSIDAPPLRDLLRTPGIRGYVLDINLATFNPRTQFEALTDADRRGGKTRKLVGGVKPLFNFKIASNDISLIINDNVEYQDIDLDQIEKFIQIEKKILKFNEPHTTNTSKKLSVINYVPPKVLDESQFKFTAIAAGGKQSKIKKRKRITKRKRV